MKLLKTGFLNYMKYELGLPVVVFENAKAWEGWLEENHRKVKGVWVRFFKKGSGKVSMTYAEAVDVALCYGWIDSQMKGYDEVSYIQRFTPRGPRSIWSKINTQNVERLIREKKMKPAGLAGVERAKSDGRWEKAYDSPSTMTIPEDFLKELAKNKKAYEFFKALNKSNTYAIAWRLQTAKKPETRQRRMMQIVEMLAKGEKFY